MPLRKNTRSNTMPLETIKPSKIPIIKTIAFLGLTGFGCVTALSIIRTFPIALDFAILSSCWRLSNCIYTARPDSTSLLRRNISCCVSGIDETRLFNFPFSSCKVFRFSIRAL